MLHQNPCGWELACRPNDTRLNDTRRAGSYNMEQVADRGFVAVTINYRLGALGFLSLASLSSEAASGSSGNYGLRDIALALEWVQSNVANFGGDPRRVTLVGHGSGATNALGLSVSPLAANAAGKLFHGLVLLSANPRIDAAREDAEASNQVFAAAAGCPQDEAASQVACLRKLDAAAVLRFSPMYKWDPRATPLGNQNDLPVKGARSPGLIIVDGQVIPEGLWEALGKRALVADVPVMATVMAEEADAQPPRRVASWADLRRAVGERLDSFGDFWPGGDAAATSFTAEVLRRYPEATYPDPQLAYATMINDARLTCATKKAVGLLASSSAQNIYLGVNHLRLEEPVVVVGLSSSGVRSSVVGAMGGEAMLADYASKYSFHGLDVVLYMQDESRYKLTAQDKMTAASFQGLLDAFIRSGATDTANRFSAPNPLAWSWKRVTDSPNFETFKSLHFAPQVDVADITAALGQTHVSMTYDFHSSQCDVWAHDQIDLQYANAA